MKFLTTTKNYTRDHWKLLTFVLLVIIAGGFWWYQRSQANTEEVVLIHPEVRTLTQTLDVSGRLDAKEKVQLRFSAGGKVVYIGAKEGDTVKKFQTLATIDKAALQKQLNQDLNDYMKERLDWEETLDTNQDKTLDTTENRAQDKDQLDLNNQVLNVEIRSIAIQNTVLTAPFEGILTAAPQVVPGVQLQASDYFEVVNPSSIYILAEVDESDIGLVQTGQQAKVVLDAFTDTELSATVQRVAFTSNQSSTGTVFKVEFLLEPSEVSQKLRLGMNGDVSIVLAEKTDVLSVPIIATIERDNKVYVQMQNEAGEVVDREITTGLETDEFFEVTSGLSTQDLIISPE